METNKDFLDTLHDNLNAVKDNLEGETFDGVKAPMLESLKSLSILAEVENNEELRSLMSEGEHLFRELELIEKEEKIWSEAEKAVTALLIVFPIAFIVVAIIVGVMAS